MHQDILDSSQRELFPFIASFGPMFYLAGGTALALQLGHRQSIDFDLFSSDFIDGQRMRSAIRKSYAIDYVLVDSAEELTVVVHSVKVTFLRYPFQIPHEVVASNQLTMPNPLTIGAMKAFALGQRAKWKDYVDLFFIFQRYSLREVVDRATSLFQNEFSEKLFREQLAYHDDINYSERVIFMNGFEIDENTIRERLAEISIS